MVYIILNGPTSPLSEMIIVIIENAINLTFYIHRNIFHLRNTEAFSGDNLHLFLYNLESNYERHMYQILYFPIRK